MIAPQWSQRDPRWSQQRLGTVNATTIGSHGCGITCLAMMDGGFDPNNPWTPDKVDNLLTAKGGYANNAGNGTFSPAANCNLLVWSRIPVLFPNCGYVGADWTPSSPANIAKIQNHLNSGGAVIAQVGFGGIAANMHFVLLVRAQDNDIVFHDPWFGDAASFASGRYGANAAVAINVAHYFVDRIPNTPPPAPIAPAPQIPVALPTAPPPIEPKPEPIEVVKPVEAPETVDALTAAEISLNTPKAPEGAPEVSVRPARQPLLFRGIIALLKLFRIIP